jgi:SAM-dependent methyltransferase
MPTDPLITWEEAVDALKRRPESDEFVKACFYDDPLIDAAQRYWQSTEWRAVRALLPAPGGFALDVGAGRGISSYALARDGWRVTALEPNSSASVGAGAIRQLAEEAALEIDVAQTGGEELPFPADTFDVVHCRQVLHHARDLGLLCRQLGRVLKPGGAFIATREHVISRREDLAAFLDGHPLHRFYGGEHAYLLDEYIDAVERAGIKIDRVLNPLQSDINMFPLTLDDTKTRWAKRLHLPSPKLVPDAALALWGARSRAPGRLYSFVGRKSAHD